jgi:hypothetical protein
MFKSCSVILMTLVRTSVLFHRSMVNNVQKVKYALKAIQVCLTLAATLHHFSPPPNTGTHHPNENFNQFINFDNIPNSFLAIFVIISLEGTCPPSPSTSPLFSRSSPVAALRMVGFHVPHHEHLWCR